MRIPEEITTNGCRELNSDLCLPLNCLILNKRQTKTTEHLQQEQVPIDFKFVNRCPLGASLGLSGWFFIACLVCSCRHKIIFNSRNPLSFSSACLTEQVQSLVKKNHLSGRMDWGLPALSVRVAQPRIRN